jgi:S1-C subfamily serine protease
MMMEDAGKPFFRRSAMRRSVLLSLVLGYAVAFASVGAAETTPVSTSQEEVKVRLEKIFAGDPPLNVDDLKAMQSHVKELTAKVLPCTVGVQIGQAWGSGVIVSKDGYVLTAAHVAGQANKGAMFVLADGRIVHGKTLGLNRGLDAGLMKITDAGEYPFMEMGKSGGLKDGTWCLAVGHPGGYQKDRGLVVRLGRVLVTKDDAITSDCTLVGGDSGGPLFDMQGRVIGINSRIANAITANLHVPVDTFRDGWDRMVKADVWGHLPGQEPVLGVNGTKDVDVAKISNVAKNSPAEKGGLKEGDVVIRFGDKDITDFPSLKQAVFDHNPGDKVVTKLKRGEEQIEVTVTLGRRSED